MPLVCVERFVAGPPEAAYALAKDMESYPQFMKDVVELRVLERDGNAQVSAWVGRLQGKLMRWKERDVFDDQHRVITYRQVEGDLKKFEGDWRFVAEGQGTRVSLSVDFELGVPMLAGLLDPVARLVVRRNCEAMLEGIKARVEAGQLAAQAGPRRPTDGGAGHGGPPGHASGAGGGADPGPGSPRGRSPGSDQDPDVAAGSPQGGRMGDKTAWN